MIADTAGQNWKYITDTTSNDWYITRYWNDLQNKIYFSYSSNGNDWSIKEMNNDGDSITLLSSCFKVGVAQMANHSNFNVYPNPAADYLFKESDATFANATMYNLLGARVSTSTDKKLNISALAPGVYILILKDSNGELLYKSKIFKQ